MKTNKKLVFTVTSGRSGTSLLAYQLSLLKKVNVFHEATPHFYEVMRKAQSDPSIAVAFWKEKKLPFINACAEQIYIETSHYTCKGFLEPLIYGNIIPALIILRRDIRATAKSLYQLNTIPGKNTNAYLSPIDPGVLKIREWEKLNDYQLCYWYCLEIKRRQDYYERLILQNAGRVSKIDLEELISGKGVFKIVKELQLPGLSSVGYMKYLYRKIYPLKTNQKKGQKKRLFDREFDFEHFEKEVESLIIQ